MVTNPNPVAPKTDTPATQIPERYKTEYRDVIDGPVPSNTWAWEKERVKGLNLFAKKLMEELGLAESTLAAERASRVQAEEALKVIEESDFECQCDDHTSPDCCAEVIGRDPGFFCAHCFAGRSLSKPSVSPEQAEEK